LKILDPACGSGAFLNQALEFLLEEHQFVDEYRRQLEKDSLGLFDIKKSILENNIFGVDINEESVEIAKLSLWLRTAERGRKLSELSNTIKCGNSLIDDPEVAGEKAFKWEEEFPQVFKIKEEKAWHITFATHDSRASQRMIDHKVRLRRHNGTRPYAMPVWLEMEDEIKVTEYISGVIKEDKLKVPAYNICGEHVHLILVCEKEERDGIVGKIKAVSSRQYNIWAGKTIPATKTDAPDADKGTGTVADTGATVTDTGIVATRGHVPLSASSPKQHTPSSEKPRAQAHLWTQKYGKKEITDQKQLYNTIEYINNNRKKHGLPFSKELQSIVQEMTCSIDHAFQTEYKGGFDVVIGNPPYLRIQGLKDACPQMALYYEEHYTSATGNYDLYALFIENSFRLINETGYVSFILPHKFLIADFGIGIRGFLLENRALKELIHFGSELVFQDSTTYTCIISLSKREKSSFSFKHIVPAQLFNEISFSEILYNKLAEKQWILTDNKIGGVLNKLSNQPLQLKDVFDRFVQGVITGKDAVFCVSGDLNGSYLEIETETGEKRLIEKDILKPHLRGEDVGKYKHLVNNEWLIFPYKLDAKKAELFTPNEMIDKFPRTFEYLKLFEPILRERENGKFDNEYWYQYSRNQAISVLEQAKIITPEICNGGSMTLDLNNFYHNSKCHTLLINRNSGYMLKSILPFINSRLFWFFISNTGNILRGNYIGVKRRVLEPFPVPSSDVVNHDFFIQLTDEIMKQTSDFQNIQSNFNDLLQNKFEIEKLSNKLQNWHKLKFKEFLKELKKAKVQLSLSEEAEWMEFFNIQKHKAVDLQTEIDCIDKEIDQMVYELYGLNEEEIQIVENSFEKLN
jgi:type I restriction-modification system DNA methylase subunit